MTNEAKEAPLRIDGAGAFTPPSGLTREDCERLAREADQKRKERP